MVSAYKNSKGTINQTFQIGTRGITLGTHYRTDEEGGKIIKDLLADGTILLSQDNASLFFPKHICSSIIEDEEKNSYAFTLSTYDKNRRKWVTNTIYIPRGAYSPDIVAGPESVKKAGNIAIFADETGKKLEDSEIGIVSEIDTSSKEDSIPTTNAIINFLRKTVIPLDDRMSGENDNKIEI